MTPRRPQLLLIAPEAWVQSVDAPIQNAGIDVHVHGRRDYDPAAISYVLSFRPPHGLLKSLPNLRAIFSLGAGVDGFLNDPDYPVHVPLVRYVDSTLARDMTHYVILHTLIHHRRQRDLDLAQKNREWAEDLPHRRTEDTRVGILGLGEIGTLTALRLRDLGFVVAGWSRSEKSVTGVETFVGPAMLAPFLARSDIAICLLPLTPSTRGILSATAFAQLPAGAYVINAARGGHLIEADLIDAIDSGHLAGAALDVFEVEPLPASSPLWAHPKITISPHIAALSYPEGILRMVMDGVRLAEAGLPLHHVVSLANGY